MEFPPYQTTGCFRSLNFVKYLNKYGIDPIVITVNPEDGYLPFNSFYNDKLLALIPENIKIYRVNLKKPNYSSIYAIRKIQKYFKTSDVLTKNWEPYLLECLPEVIKAHNPKAIYISSPPFISSTIAPKLKKLFALPVLLDMRDAWSKWAINPYSTYIHYLSVYLREKKAFKAATSIITVTQELKEVFCNSHSDVDSNKFHVIPNGFDDTYSCNSIEFSGTNNIDRVVKIGYVGSYYYQPNVRNDLFGNSNIGIVKGVLNYSPIEEDWLYRSPYFYLKTMACLFKLNPSLKNKLQFIHIGKKPNWMDSMVKLFGLQNNVIYTGFLPFDQVDKELDQIDLFLSTSVKINLGKDYALASKTFDYVLQKKPILGFVKEGAQFEFLDNSNTGIIFDPDQIELSAEKLKDIICNGLILKPNIPYLKEFERLSTSRKLSEIIKKVIK